MYIITIRPSEKIQEVIVKKQQLMHSTGVLLFVYDLYIKVNLYFIRFIYQFVLTNRMGSAPSPSPQLEIVQTLTVATLNYCGIMNSPFQFYCEDYLNELKNISKLFTDLLPNYFPRFGKQKFQWKMGKIDHIFRNRYSPMFRLQVGINKDNQTIMSKADFIRKWEQQFKDESKIPKELKKQRQKLKQNQTKQQKELQFEQQRQQTLNYDLAMFHTLLKYVFGDIKQNKPVAQGQKYKQQIDDYKDLPAEKYQNKLRPFHNLSFLDAQSKRKKVQKNFKRIDADIFFFQQYSQQFYQQVEKSNQYYLSHDNSKDTMIIARKKSFRGQQPLNTEEFMKKRLDQRLIAGLNWAEHSAFMIIDHYFFICAHLSSKAEINLPQITSLKENLIKLKEQIPQFHIIVGGDLNSFLENFSPMLFHIYPEEDQQMTTIKKRTCTQGQFKKADKTVCESKDKIISSLKILDGRTSYITGKTPQKDNLVPTDQHPFDHFVIVTILEKPLIKRK